MSAEILIGQGTTVQHRLCAVCNLQSALVAFDNSEKTDLLLLENN